MLLKMYYRGLVTLYEFKFREIISKELHLFRGYVGPTMRPKNKSCFSQIYSYYFIRTIAQVLKSDINLTYTVAMVTNMAAKIG